MDGTRDEDAESGRDKVNWKWVRYETRSHTPHLIFSYKTNLWKTIRKRLVQVGEGELLSRFSAGCFGHLLEWHQPKSSGLATYAVVSRQITLDDTGNTELWFRVFGQNLRFSYREYALVTGLKFGSSPFNPNGWHVGKNVGVYKRFMECDKTSIGDLLELFIQGVDGATFDDYLKIANLLVLYLFCLGYNPSKVVEDFAWVLVDNLDAWNNFPWGGYTYQALVHYIFQVGRTKEECVQRMHVFGPVWALQIWSFEAIPDLGAAVAIITTPNRLPRCLRWTFKRPNVKNFNKFFKRNLKAQCLETLEPESTEECQEYWVTAAGENPIGVHYEKPFNLFTARSRVDGPIRKSKLIRRKKELENKRRQLHEERSTYKEKQRKLKENMKEEGVVNAVEMKLKEIMHIESKKMVFQAWCHATGASSSKQ